MSNNNNHHNDLTNVQAAFEILLEEIEAEIEVVTKAGAKAFEVRDYDRARAALAEADQSTAFRDKVAAVRSEWEKISLSNHIADPAATQELHNLSRLHRGLRTRENAYFKPILLVLSQMGGSGQVSEVLVRLQKVMKGTLSDVDYEPLASDPEVPRWWNTAQWAHSSMVQSGLLKGDSPRGVWEMTEAGMKLIVEVSA